jgi:hypothetical protein
MDIPTGATGGNQASLTPIHFLAFRRLRKNYRGMQDAHKGQTSHPPNPGAPKRA